MATTDGDDRPEAGGRRREGRARAAGSRPPGREGRAWGLADAASVERMRRRARPAGRAAAPSRGRPARSGAIGAGPAATLGTRP